MVSNRLRVLLAATGAVAIVAILQVVNTVTVRKRLCTVLGSDGRCTAQTGLASVRLANGTLPLGSGQEQPLAVSASTRLIRRSCDGSWTGGFGARIDAGGIELANDFARFRVGTACVDAGIGGGMRGVIRDGAISVRECTIRLGSLQGMTDQVELALTASIDRPAIPACSALLPEHARAAAQKMAEGGELVMRYEFKAASSIQTLLNITTTNRTGALRRLVSTISTTHAIDATIARGRASLLFTTQPSGQSAEVRLKAEADAEMMAHVPSDLAPSRSGPLTLEVDWDVDHQRGTARVNGEAIARIPLRASRAAGRIQLSSDECRAANRSLFFVEAGDRGEALERAQLSEVFSAVEGAVAGPGVLVTVFVHGWHHSAALGDAYVCRFSDVLASVEDMEQRAAALSGRPRRTVVGVYVGWQGALYPNDLANSVTTFWNRLDAADHLGQTDGILRRLLDGLSERLARARTTAKAERRSSLIVTGHSMGARAVFAAVADDLLQPDAAPPTRRQPDLVLLVNPAFSASLFRAVHEASRECRRPRTPLLLFSSESDGVTRQLYPAGQTVTYDYASRERAPFFEHIYTAANFDEFVTHRLTLEPLAGDTPAADGPQTILRGFERTPSGSKELYSDNPVTVYRQPAVGRPAQDDVWYRMRLREAPSAKASCGSNPGTSKVIAVDGRILPDHGRIFTPPFVEYVVRVLNRRALETSSSP